MADFEVPEPTLIRPNGMGPTVDPQSAGEPWQGAAKVGNAIAGLGDHLAQIYQQVSESQTRTKLGDMEVALTKAQTAHEDWMMQPGNQKDPKTWVPDYQTRLDAVRKEFIPDTASQEDRLVLGNAFKSFEARSVGEVMKTATVSAFQNERQTYANLISAGESTGDEGLRQKGLSWYDLHLPPAAAEQERMNSDRRANLNRIRASIQTNPGDWQDRLKDPETAAKNGVDLQDFPEMQSFQREAQTRRTSDRIKDAQDRIASDQNLRPEDLDKQFADIRPEARAVLKESMAQQRNAANKALFSSPEWEAKVVGEVTADSADWNPNTAGYDVKLADMESKVRTLPEGSGARNQLLAMLNRRVTGQAEDVRSRVDMVKKIAMDAYKAGSFGAVDLNPNYAQPLGQVVASGPLRDPAFLARSGLSKDQAAAVAGMKEDDLKNQLKPFMPEEEAEATSKALAQRNNDQGRMEAFRLLYPRRADQGAQPIPFEQAAIDAIVGEKPLSYSVEIPSAEQASLAQQSKERAQEKLGLVLQRLSQWAATTPNPTEVEAERMAVSIAGEAGRQKLIDGQRGAQAATGPSLSVANASDPYQLGPNLLETVKTLEGSDAPGGFHRTAYWDHGQWSIGYGTKSKPGEVITQPEAEERLKNELAIHAKRVDDMAAAHGYRFTPAQRDSLASFDFNTGDLDQLLVQNGQRSNAEIVQAMKLYNQAADTKRVLPGLVRRRDAEARLFEQGYPPVR